MQSLTKVTESFPYKTLSIINGEPTYSSMNKMKQEIYSNAESVSTTLGGRKSGHIGLIMKTDLYRLISRTTFQIPEDPGTSPQYPTTERSSQSYTTTFKQIVTTSLPYTKPAYL